MTPAENLCQELDGTTRGKCPGCEEYGVPPQMEQAAALIRRLAAALVEYHWAHVAGGWAKDGIEKRHAEALRDVGE